MLLYTYFRIHLFSQNADRTAVIERIERPSAPIRQTTSSTLAKETDTRIIIGSFSQDLAPQVLCEAFRLRMFGADYAWILHESMGAPCWNDISARGTNCSPKELQDAVENLIIIASHNRIVGNKTSYSGLVSRLQ